MTRPVVLFALLACVAVAAAARQLPDYRTNEVEDAERPVVVLVDKAFDGNALPDKRALGYTTPRPWYRTSTRRPNTTSRRPATTPRRPTTSTRRPTTSTRRPTTPSPLDQSFTIGGVYPFDMQLSSTPVYKASTILTVHSLDLHYTDPSRRAIHCIQVVDVQKNGRNAAVTVQSGGVGQSAVSMRFKSQRGENINYLVRIWGS